MTTRFGSQIGRRTPDDEHRRLIASGANGLRKRVGVVDYTEVLRHLAINDEHFSDAGGTRPGELDPKTLALVRLAALIAIGGAEPSYGAQADAAVGAGATAANVVDVLVGVLPIVGWPIVVAAAPKVAMALGYDTDEAFERYEI